MTPHHNHVLTLRSDPRLRVAPLEERLAINGGLQPYAARTTAGAMLAQVQLPARSFPSDRIAFYWMIGTYVSRDDGATWERVELSPGQNGLFMEGSNLNLPDGDLLLLDTYVTPGAAAGEGRGLSQRFRPDLRTWDALQETTFDLPGFDFEGVDDGGNPHRAARLHRRVLALPGGDLLATIYGWFHEDKVTVNYMPNGRKVRTMLLRSSDQGKHWRYITTIAGAAGTDVGSEGYCEPDLVRLTHGPHAGRLLCLMRTGRALFCCQSDDEGATWTAPVPEQFDLLDVNQPAAWAPFFANTSFEGYARDMEGAFVDPNLIELQNGVVACAFGLRIPEKLCWSNPRYIRNGNYLAFSFDHGATWSHVVQMTGGVMTTHYMNLLEIAPNRLQVLYDCGGRWEDGFWDGKQGRYTAVRDLVLHFNL